jgi:hypothetical protein
MYLLDSMPGGQPAALGRRNTCRMILPASCKHLSAADASRPGAAGLSINGIPGRGNI